MVNRPAPVTSDSEAIRRVELFGGRFLVKIVAPRPIWVSLPKAQVLGLIEDAETCGWTVIIGRSAVQMMIEFREG